MEVWNFSIEHNGEFRGHNQNHIRSLPRRPSVYNYNSTPDNRQTQHVPANSNKVTPHWITSAVMNHADVLCRSTALQRLLGVSYYVCRAGSLSLCRRPINAGSVGLKCDMIVCWVFTKVGKSYPPFSLFVSCVVDQSRYHFALLEGPRGRAWPTTTD